MNIPTTAWRNIWRNRRRTLITLSSIALATMLAVLMTGMQDASWRDVIDVAARMGGGHVTLQHPDYLDKPSLSRTVTDGEHKAKLALEDGSVRRVVPRIVGQTLLSTAHGSFGAGFIAFDPNLEDEDTLSILEAIAEGKSFENADEGGILLGARLAANLGVTLGKKIVYTMTDREGQIVTGLVRVSGIVKTGSPAVDLGLCLLPIDNIRAVLGYANDEATQVALFLDDNRESATVAGRMSARFGDETAALTWKEVQPDLNSFIAMKKGGMVVFEALILILCAAGIFNTLFVSVMERLREFGILIAVGFPPARLFSLVMVESLWLGLVGLALGVILVAWPYHYLSRSGIDFSALYADQQSIDVAGVGMSMVMKIGIYPESAAAIALAVLAATLLSGLYPAWRAGRVEPVDSIKLV
jgi:ABC-type lipoprotein release transport system permease subunit